MKHNLRPRRATRSLAVVGIVVAASTGCGPTITAPNVVGMRLDAAHRAFEKLDVDGFEDVDVVGKEDTIYLDSNWVVLSQDPPAGTKEVDTGTTIKLEVGNEDDSEVLDEIPEDSPFAVEMADDEEVTEDPEPVEEPEPTSTPSPSEEPTPTAKPSSSSPADKERQAAVQCARRTSNAGEIYAWYSYGSDQPPDALRLGGGYVWNWGDHQCQTSADWALSTNPPLPGYCTEVGTVAANPGYPVNARPAPRLAQTIGAEGDC